MRTLFVLPFALALSSTALAQDAAPIASQGWNASDWNVEASDIPVDPDFSFGVLDNGMRYILRENATPKGTVLVRFHIGSGSLDEEDGERGLAHFIEHMAFNGSARVPEGEMIKLLEREGLAFGADTNATTSFESTIYKLDLPRNDPALLDTALMLMRETASELTIAQDAVDRERGVVLSERRDRYSYSYKETVDQLEFTAPGARFVDRLPIGTVEVLERASADDLRALYRRTYVPSNAVLVVVGDLPLAEMEARVRKHFASWQAAPDPAEPATGPADLARAGETDIYIDPALTERVQAMRLSPWTERPDTIANRQKALLRQIGYGVINRRLQALARGADAPFRGAGYGTGDLFKDGRTTSLVVDTDDGGWEKGLGVAATELRRALAFGFSEAEVAEQVARIRTALENGANGSATRTNDSLVAVALNLIDEEQVPSTPESSLNRFEAFAPQITPENTLAAVLEEAAPLVDPLIRFEGRIAPERGAQALRETWQRAETVELVAPDHAAPPEFAYTDFGPAGAIISDGRDDRFGFRLVRFANGVRLNLKKTDIRKDRVSFRLTLDGGQLLETREAPLKTALVSSLPQGGLGEHSQDELETILAGRSVRLSISASADAFSMGGGTTPRDLALQLQLLAAFLTDPGYRPEGVERYRRNVKSFFASLDATPAQALGNQLGAILSDHDPRFTLQPQEAYEALTFEQLAVDIGDRLTQGAIELALVGDFDEEAAIGLVAQTLGALPAREGEFNARAEARQRSFTQDHSTRRITHSGEADQALVRMTWLTTDDSDLDETLRLSLLDRVVQIELQEQLREDLGKSYSPSSDSSPSKAWPGYGTFALSASVDVKEVEPTRAAIRDMLVSLRIAPVEQDVLDRARQPLLEAYENMLDTLEGWMSLADRSQSEADRLGRFLRAPDILKAITPADILATAQRYLAPEDAVEVLVLPREEAGQG